MDNKKYNFIKDRITIISDLVNKSNVEMPTEIFEEDDELIGDNVASV